MDVKLVIILISALIVQSSKTEDEEEEIFNRNLDPKVHEKYQLHYQKKIDYSIDLHMSLRNPVLNYYYLNKLFHETNEIFNLFYVEFSSEFNITEDILEDKGDIYKLIGPYESKLLSQISKQVEQLKLDLNTSIKHLLRFQEIFDLDVETLALNNISGDAKSDDKKHIILSEDDCFKIGRSAASYNQHERAIEWMRYGLMWASKHIQTMPAEEELIELLKDLSHSLYQVGDIHTAISVLNSLLDLDSEDGEIKNILPLFKSMKHFNVKTKDELFLSVCKEYFQLNISLASTLTCKYQEYSIYNMLRVDMEPDEMKKHLLRDIFKGLPSQKYISINAFKVEEIYPRIYFINDVISSGEAEEFVSMMNSYEPLLPAYSNMTKSYRVDNLDEHHIVSKVSKRVNLIMGDDKLKLTDFKLQDLRYAGSMIPSHTLDTLNLELEKEEENSKFQFVIFVTDNQESIDGKFHGGHHTFPYLNGVSIEPKKGSGYFYNSVDFETKHIICPQINGRKIIARLSFKR